MLLEADPETYSKPAYLPSWLSINLAGDKVDWDHVADRIAAAGSLRRRGACSKLAGDERPDKGPAAAGSPSARSSRSPR
jgi:hypothetical protein